MVHPKKLFMEKNSTLNYPGVMNPPPPPIGVVMERTSMESTNRTANDTFGCCSSFFFLVAFLLSGKV